MGGAGSSIQAQRSLTFALAQAEAGMRAAGLKVDVPAVAGGGAGWTTLAQQARRLSVTVTEITLQRRRGTCPPQLSAHRLCSSTSRGSHQQQQQQHLAQRNNVISQNLLLFWGQR